MPNFAGSLPRKRPDRTIQLPIGDEAVAALLHTAETEPDLLVEILPPLLWLSRTKAFESNSSVVGAMILLHAYEQLGIAAHVYTVTLSVRPHESDQWSTYGRLDPLWEGGVLHGHCLLWLPQSGRIVDATVEQFSAPVRTSAGFVVGRAIGMSPSDTIVAGSELVAGSYIGVAGADGDMVYQLTGPAHRDLVTSSLSHEDDERYRRTGISLASRAITLFRVGSVARRVRKAPYPRLHGLLDVLREAEFVVEPSGDFFFTVRGEEGQQSLRLDEIPIDAVEVVASRSPEVRAPQHSQEFDQIEKILRDTATEARLLQIPPPAMGGGALPVVLFEPLGGVGMRSAGGSRTFEAQAETIIAAGFGRFLPDTTIVPQLPSWSVRHTPDGVELWDEGGIWARAELTVNEEWLATAEAQRAVRVIYGVFVGVRIPRGRNTYTEADREAELLRSRRSGIVAAAEIPWSGRRNLPRTRWRPWKRRTASDQTERGMS
ncbi:hypothetical protein [Lentzea sp. HUAS12]|uniref:hypothetical protein n=1 Tax=Lentzea sp. HUAS12 TaxID=2951806 RepID=UPI00209ED9D1|nr:hypothetical protein [Lentzea sp. HUAS12]USX56331.1 hypothetical protein ND450_20190 [Lentzea sp. HUAS12]